jgi:hypothetical protein
LVFVDLDPHVELVGGREWLEKGEASLGIPWKACMGCAAYPIIQHLPPAPQHATISLFAGEERSSVYVVRESGFDSCFETEVIGRLVSKKGCGSASAKRWLQNWRIAVVKYLCCVVVAVDIRTASTKRIGHVA